MLVAMTKARSKIWIALYNTSPAGLCYDRAICEVILSEVEGSLSGNNTRY